MSNTWTTGVAAGATVPHTIASLQNGIGDPCKLVGYTVAQIKEAIANNCVPDNKKYRTPTQSENEALGVNNVSGWQQVSNTYGRWFGPAVTRQFLPGNGYRQYYNGSWTWSISGQGSTPQSGSAGYWDGSVCQNHNQAHGLVFDFMGLGALSAYRHGNTGQSSALGVRCVTQ
jgi:hypothetical protein